MAQPKYCNIKRDGEKNAFSRLFKFIFKWLICANFANFAESITMARAQQGRDSVCVWWILLRFYVFNCFNHITLCQQTHTHEIHSPSSLYYFFFSIDNVVCLAIRSLYMRGYMHPFMYVCVCVEWGADFHPIEAIHRHKFNLNEMWQMGKKNFAEFVHARSLEWMW